MQHHEVVKQLSSKEDIQPYEVVKQLLTADQCSGDQQADSQLKHVQLWSVNCCHHCLPYAFHLVSWP